MKTFFLLATICLLGTVSTAPATKGLNDDLQDFINLLPLDDIKALGLKYLHDEEVQQTLEYLTSKEFAQIWAQLSASKEFREFVYYLDDAGLPVMKHLDRLANALELPKFPSKSKRSAEATGGLKGLYDEFLALLPKDKIKALFNEKLKTSKEFAELYKKISSAEFKDVLKFVKDSPELTESFNKLRKHGIDVDGIVEIVCRIFGWKQ